MTTQGIVFLVLFVAVLAVFGLLARLLYRILRAAKPEDRFDRWGDRIKAVLVYVGAQARVLAKPAGVGHFIIFWGFIFITIGTLDHMLGQVIPGFGLERIVGRRLGSAFIFLQDVFGILVIGALAVAAVRRFILKPERLKIDDPAAPPQAALILALIFVLILFMYGLKGTEILEGSARLTKTNAPVSFSAAEMMRGRHMNVPLANSIFSWGHNLVIFFFLLFIPLSKHIHILGAIPNVFFKNLGRMGSLSRMNFEDESAEKFGVSELGDFTWKQIMDLYACTECGRCQVACPAHATQKPLSPFRMVHRLRAQLMRDRGGLFAKGADVLKPTPVIPENVSEDEIWACTTCGACMQECPTFIEHVQKIVDLRRFLVLTESRFPAEVQPVFKNMEVNYNPWAIGYSSRADWAAGLGVPLASEKRSFDVLFWVGCSGSFDQRAQKVSRSVVRLMQLAGVDFAILGTEEKCCGETARRMGNEYLAQTQIQANIETLKKYKFNTIVTACPHGLNTFLVEYPQFGLSVPVVHHSEFLLGLLSKGKLKARRIETLRGAYHDSCYLSRYNGVIREPRALLSRATKRVAEFGRRGRSSFCCGAGGGRMWMEETLGSRINEDRARELLGLGVDHVFTACPFCLTMFEDALKTLGREDVHALDVAEVLLEACSE
ncbi:MAG: (Fe-S)-binding protein [Candidatus Krumholzibacteriia bacterium]